MPSAIVTGATGMLGRHIVAELSKDPSTWITVHALSRSQKEKYPPHVKHDTIDLTGDTRKMAEQLEGVEGEYVFFTAYLAKDSEQENWDVNGAMISNFLDALTSTGAIRKLKRFMLVTGAKQYGLHLGAVKNPMEELDPWVEGKDRPPNFYYNQQNILKSHAQQHGYDWVVTYPNDVLGLVQNNFMNLITPLAIYATVCKELGGDMPFPGAEKFYTKHTTFTDATLHAQFCIWAAKTPECSNQGFNIVNGDAESYQNLWPRVAKYFGTTIPAGQFADPASKELSSESPLAPIPPIADSARERGLDGTDIVKQSVLKQRIDLVKWSQRKDVKEAWERIAERDGLEKEALGKATWWFLGFVLGREYDIVISMSKARKYGWPGYADTWETFEKLFKGLEDMKVIPKRS